jgi:putative ABC transport system permease protein
VTLGDQFRTAFSNVGRRKLRSALASLGVLVGTLTIVVMVSLASGVRAQINHQFALLGLDRLTVTPAGDRRGGLAWLLPPTRKKLITAQDVKRWKELPGVTKVQPEVNLPLTVTMDLRWNGTNEPVVVTPGENFRAVAFSDPLRPVAGSLELPDSGGIILGQGAAKGVGVPTNNFAQVIGQNVEAVLHTSRGETQSFVLRVTGVSQERRPMVQISGTDRLAMKNWWFNTTNTLEKQGYDSVTIHATDVTHARDVAAQIKKDGFQAQTLEMVLDIANRIVLTITLMFTMIASIALLVATIGIANTMVMAIYERTREIGILKAMGASRGEIRQMFMMEAGFIGLIGGAVGLLLGWLLGLLLNQVIQLYLKHEEIPIRGPFFVVTLWLAAGAILFAILIGLVAGLLPAQRAARLNPLEALRHE